MSTAVCSDPILRTESLSVEFVTDHGWTKVVDGVDLTIPPRSTVGLVGESGSGKTVTSLAVMGLLPPAISRVSGSISLHGKPLFAGEKYVMSELRGRDVSMIFQEPRRSLDPAFTVGDQIAEVVRRHDGSPRKVAWSRAVEMLDAVGIADAPRRALAYPHEFSGGMCQRVMLAIAMVCRPKLLIADEPTTALDVTVQQQMLRLMKNLQEEFDVSILFITHDLGVVAEMCDTVNVMYAGQVVESTKVDNLFLRPRHPYTQGLLDAIPNHNDRQAPLRAIGGAVPPPWSWPTSCRFADRCPHTIAQHCEVQSIALEIDNHDTAVRCVRSEELMLEGITA
ncbi:ABC transporter ATP-binding protein [Rhodococcus koreensis]